MLIKQMKGAIDTYSRCITIKESCFGREQAYGNCEGNGGDFQPKQRAEMNYSYQTEAFNLYGIKYLDILEN
jgi:hypothetical protein